MHIDFRHTFSILGLSALLFAPACSDDAGTSGSGAEGSESETSASATDTDTDTDTDSAEGNSDSDTDDPATMTDPTDSGDGDGDPTDSGDGDGDPTDSGDGDGDPTDSGDGDGDSGDGDGDMPDVCGDGIVSGDEVCDDGVNDGAYGGCSADCLSLADYCGDAVMNGPEECDDANDDSSDGCLASCLQPQSCLEILGFDDQSASGPYMIANANGLFTVECDMETDGGGWTGLSLANTCDELDTTLTPLEPAPTEGIDDQCRPFTQDAAGAHAYQWDIEFAAGYDEFYMADYVFKANSIAPNNTTDIWTTFAQVDWAVPYNNAPATGDVSFGSPDDMGPATSYGAEIMVNIECSECEEPFPGNGTLYAVGVNSTVFRIAWGENGGQAEGFYPWWSGMVFLR